MFAVAEHDRYKIVTPDCWVFPLFLISIYVWDILTCHVTDHLFSFFVPSVQCLLLPGACFLGLRETVQNHPACFVLKTSLERRHLVSSLMPYPLHQIGSHF